MERVHFVSLGCPKNRVDTEYMVGRLLRDGGRWALTDDPAEASVIVVNTCSFIQPATEESIETVLEMARLKEDGACRRLVVTGCMVQRYGEDLARELPEVDAFLGTGELHRIAEVVAERGQPARRTWVDDPTWLPEDGAPRLNTLGRHAAYLKISEGCDHRCTFCIIPRLRGRLRSRSVEGLVAEAMALVAGGVRELNLVSQDTTAYGRDRYGRSMLGPLLRALGRVEGLAWIRLHYLYPLGLPGDALEAMAEVPAVVPYVDIPLQHASGRMLRAMRRGVDRAGQERILERIRAAVPDVTLRTTFIVGFPGETEEDFEELVDFVREQRFHRVGVFTFSPEAGTPAAELPDQVPEEVREERRSRLVAVQAGIARAHNEALVGREVEVMLDGPAPEAPGLLAGRLASQAPEVDGRVLLPRIPPGARPGHLLACRVTRAGPYDLVAEPLGPLR